MPIERRPHNPLPQRFVPTMGRAYRVKSGEDWHTIARDNHITAQELIYFNFATHDPAEVNYYLKRNVGCVEPTHDHKNWKFSSEASPGIIYLPPTTGWKRPSFPPAPVVPEAPVAPAIERSGIWFGFGAQGGGHGAVGGKDTVEACLYSLESYEDHFWLNIDGWRIGPGLGGSVGVVFVVATGGKSPQAFSGLKVGGWDFQANLGGRWGDLAKGIKGLAGVAKFAKAAKFIDKTVEAAKWEKMRELVRNAIKAGTLSTHPDKPEVNVMGIPGLGVGLEVSVYYGSGDCYVHGVSLRR